QPNRLASYPPARLALVAVDGSDAPTFPAPDFDRAVSAPQFAPVMPVRAVEVLVADDRSVYPATISLADHSVTKLAQPPIVSTSVTHAGACTASLLGQPDHATEVYG